MPLEIRGLSKGFGDHPVLSGVDLIVAEGKTTVVLGPSGCGKTTMLRIIAGLETPDTGQIIGVEGKVSVVFQEPAVLPWMTVRENCELPLIPLTDRENRRRRVTSILDLVGLGDYADWYPGKLSGGMKRRVSLARAFAYPSSLVLLDEPFQGLDLKLKMNLAADLDALRQSDPRTVLLVTHDVREALTLGDEILLFTGRPARVKERLINGPRGSERKPGQPAFQERESTLYGWLLK